MSNDFRLVERNAVLGDKRGEQARSTLRTAWPTPRDTFVTEDIPFLLARLSQIGE